MFYELGVTSAAGSELSAPGARVCQGERVRSELLCLKFPQKHFCTDLWLPRSVVSCSAVDGDFVSNQVN